LNVKIIKKSSYKNAIDQQYFDFLEGDQGSMIYTIFTLSVPEKLLIKITDA
jgi:hypothetical protein